MIDMAANILLVGRVDHALFRNDRGDQFLRGDIESGVENTSTLRRERFAEDMRHVFWIALPDAQSTSMDDVGPAT